MENKTHVWRTAVILTVLFAILKIVGVAKFSWWIVLFPIWGLVALMIVALILSAVYIVICVAKDKDGK